MHGTRSRFYGSRFYARHRARVGVVDLAGFETVLVVLNLVVFTFRKKASPSEAQTVFFKQVGLEHCDGEDKTNRIVLGAPAGCSVPGAPPSKKSAQPTRRRVWVGGWSFFFSWCLVSFVLPIRLRHPTP